MALRWTIDAWELLAVLIALLLWGDILARSAVQFRVDNSSAAYIPNKTTTSCPIANVIVRIIARILSTFRINVWWSWISTVRNTADELSRIAYLRREDIPLRLESWSADGPLATVLGEHTEEGQELRRVKPWSLRVPEVARVPPNRTKRFAD